MGHAGRERVINRAKRTKKKKIPWYQNTQDTPWQVGLRWTVVAKIDGKVKRILPIATAVKKGLETKVKESKRTLKP